MKASSTQSLPKFLLHVSSVAALLVFGAAHAAALPPLFEDGATEWKVVVRDGAPPPVAFAAQELTNALKRVSGATFEIVPEGSWAGPAIVIRAGDGQWGDEKVSYGVAKNGIVLSGNQPRAALHAAYAFLQREMGVRWLWPGEDGAFYPKRGSWSVPAGFGFSHTPSIRYRGFHHCGDWRDREAFNLWQTRNFAVIHRHGVYGNQTRYGQYSMLSSHNANLNGEKELFAAHPECFSEISGRRTMLNICFSSDLAAEKVAEKLARDLRRASVPVDILSIFPNDSQDYCKCAACGAAGVSTSWFSFYGKVVRILAREFPGLRFATLAYQGYRDVPANPVELTEFVEYTTHGRCHVHKWGDAACGNNVRDLARFEEWLSRGGVPMGNYSYEYDSISRRSVFMPFFSIVGDAVETGARQGLVAMIPEVSLSPRTGPDLKAHSVQNRLTILYYAWKMWDATLTLDDFLADVASNAFGPAAGPMKEYFLLMDEAWGRMGRHIGLFADGMDVSSELLRNDGLRRRAGELLAKAEKLSVGDLRANSNVQRESALFGQMLEYRDMKAGNEIAINLPLQSGADTTESRAPWHALRNTDGTAGAARARGHWTRAAAGAVGEDGELVLEWGDAGDAKATIFLDEGDCYEFAFANGKRSQRWVSSVGVEAADWNPAWTVERGGRRMAFRIPLGAFARIPAAGDSWRARLTSDGGSLPSREDMTARLAFIGAGAADRPVAYCGGDEREVQRAAFLRELPALRLQAEADGWRLIACTNREDLAEAAKEADTFLIKTPRRDTVPPETADLIREKVKAGGTLVVRSWWTIPLEQILNDPSHRSHCAAPKDFPLGERKAKWVRGGDWCRTPWDVERQIRHGYAPCYMQVPDAPAGQWVEYASMPLKDDPAKMAPFIAATRYGKGAVIIVGESLNVSHFRLVDNIRKDLGL